MACTVFALDQWTKSWAQQSLGAGRRHHIVATLYLVLTYNRGAAFSLGSGASPFVVGIAVVAAIGVMWFSGRLAHGGATYVSLVGFGLVGGGALSNLADRALRHHHGAVVDFIQLVSWWPVFNVADAAITVGAVLAGASLLLFQQARPGGTRPVTTWTGRGGRRSD